MLCSLPLEYNSITHWSVLNEVGDFLLSVLIDEDEGVVFGVSGIVLVPPFSRVH